MKKVAKIDFKRIQKDQKNAKLPIKGSTTDTLFVAAPELLRECEYALEMLKDEKRSEVLASMGHRNFVHRLTEVINKAKGLP